MKTSIMRLVPRDGYEIACEGVAHEAPPQHRLEAHVRRAIVEARGWLELEQRSEGAWSSRTEGESTLQSQYILILAFLGEADSPRAQAVARGLIQQQLPTGGWSRCPGGSFDISASVQAYFALKLAGHPPHAAFLQQSREAILAAGGAEGVCAATRLYLALLGQISFKHCPSPLASTPESNRESLRASIWEQRPVTQIDPRRGIRELFLRHPEQWPIADSGECDDRPEFASSLLWKLVELTCLGHAEQSPSMLAVRESLEELVLEEDEVARLQPFQAPVRDTALAVRSLIEAGIRPDEGSIVAAAVWLHEQATDKHPSRIDEAALVAQALGELSNPVDEDLQPAGLQLLADSVDDPREVQARVVQSEHASAASQLERRLLSAQNADGGWGTYRSASTSSDQTGLVLEALGKLGRRAGDPAVDRAVEFLQRSQEPDGSWRGQNGVNHIHGTWQAISGLTAVGVGSDDPHLAAGVNWLLAWQQACGGWGETPVSDDNPRLRGQGPVTASQTSWALLALIAAGLAADPAVARGVRFLVSEQSEDGAWHEPEFTGAFLPDRGHFRSDLWRGQFPLLALSRWLAAVDA